jgi:hypothetical protein
MSRRSFDCGVYDTFAQDDNFKLSRDRRSFDCGVCDTFAQDDSL